MSITTQNGGRIVTETRKRIRKKDEVEKRARIAFEMLCERTDKELTARTLGVTVRHLNRLVRAMPMSLKRAIKRAGLLFHPLGLRTLVE